MPTKKVVLYAQPSDEFPYLKKSDLKEQEYVETDALFGALPFTDIGEEAWRAFKSISKGSAIRLVKVGFSSVPWTVLFNADGIRAVVTCQKYTSGQFPEDLYIEIKSDGETYMVKKFIRRLYGRLERKPWKMTDWDDFEKATGKDMKTVIASWKKYSQKEHVVQKPKLPEVVDTTSQLEYKQDAIMVKVMISNQKSLTIKDITITLDADKTKLEADSWEQGVPRLNSTGSYTAMFKVRAKTIIKDEPLKLTFRYNDGKKKKRELDALAVTVAPPDIKGETAQPEELDSQLPKFGKREELGQTQRRPAADLFNDLVDALGKTGLYMLDPNIERRGGTYIGIVRLHGTDPDGIRYILQVKVQGDMNESRVIRTLYSSNPEKVSGFKQFVDGLAVFGKMFEAKS